jgi:hypothetical protein
LAVFTIASAGLAAGGAEAQPYGRAQGFRVAEHGRGRGQERREERREDRRGGPPGQQYRQEYRPPAYDRGPSRGAYAYPAPREPYAQRRAPPVYSAPPPPPYDYPQAQAPAPWRNSLGAYSGREQQEARRGVREGRAMPLGQLTEGIRRAVPGRMLDAFPETGPDGRPAYRIRWAASGGRRIDFIVDAATGAIIGQSGY